MEFFMSASAFLPAGMSARNNGMLIATTIPHATKPNTGFAIGTNRRKS